MTTPGSALYFAWWSAPAALFPVTGGLPHLDRLPHAVLDALGVLPGVAFAVVADENRLTKRNIVGDAVDGIMCALRVFDAAVFVVAETVGAFLGAVYEAPVFVFDLPGQLNKQILAAGCPHRRDE